MSNKECESCGERPAKHISDFSGYMCKGCFVEDYFEHYRAVACAEMVCCSKEQVENDWETKFDQ